MKNKKVKNKNFINKESLCLREKLQKNLFDKFDEINILNNLNYNQYRALLYFRLNKPFQIIECDKNIGFAIISTELYDKSALDYLNNNPSYSSIQDNQLSSIVVNINNKLDTLFLNNHISKDVKKTISINKLQCKSGIFRMMSKLHKEIFGWRPIQNCSNHPTAKLSMFFDYLFKPFILNSVSYIKDSQNLIQLCQNIRFSKKPFIYSLDFSNLYTNIDPNHAIPILTEFVSKHLDSSHLTAFGLSSLLFLFFENNIFNFKSKFFIQIKGVPMGCVCGPSLANLYLYILELKWLTIHKPLIYYRFIDDIFLVLEYPLDFENFESFFIYLKLSLATGDKVNFLDLFISFNNFLKKLKFSVYVKKTHINKYLLPSSNHPNHMFKNIIYNLFYRIRRICSDYYDFIDASVELAIKLLERNYLSKDIREAFFHISNLDRDKLIPYKIKRPGLDFNKDIPFFFIFNSNFSSFKKALSSSYNNTSLKFPILNNFYYKHINNIDVNLKRFCIHNFNFSFPLQCKTFTCNNCRVCNFIFNSSFIRLNNNINLNFISNGSCNSSFLVYIIFCMKCKIFYVGETQNTFKQRISQHLDDIYNFIPFRRKFDKEVAVHFNLKGHNYLNDFKCAIYKDKLNDSLKRKSVEMDLINFLNKFHSTCINIKTEKNIFNTLCFI